MSDDEKVTMSVRRMRKMATAIRALRANILLNPPLEDMRRAGGDVECATCNLEYRDHPEHPRAPFLTVLCSGELVKL